MWLRNRTLGIPPLEIDFLWFCLFSYFVLLRFSISLLYSLHPLHFLFLSPPSVSPPLSLSLLPPHSPLPHYVLPIKVWWSVPVNCSTYAWITTTTTTLGKGYRTAESNAASIRWSSRQGDTTRFALRTHQRLPRYYTSIFLFIRVCSASET